MDIAFISCVSKKREGKHIARELYISALFNKSLKYCEKNFDKVYILSAKYGMLELNDKIENYNLTLNNFKKAEKKKWAFEVYNSIIEKVDPKDEIFWFCGMNYRKYLMRVLQNKQHEPLKGLEIGDILKWFKQKT